MDEPRLVSFIHGRHGELYYTFAGYRLTFAEEAWFCFFVRWISAGCLTVS